MPTVDFRGLRGIWVTTRTVSWAAPALLAACIASGAAADPPSGPAETILDDNPYAAMIDSAIDIMGSGDLANQGVRVQFCRPFDPICMALMADDPRAWLTAMVDAGSIDEDRAHGMRLAVREARCLALTAWVEARDQPRLGQIAVMQTLINRVMAPRYPSTICRVAMQPWQYATFRSDWADTTEALQGGRDQPWPGPIGALADARMMLRLHLDAWEVMSGRIADPTDGAQYFYAPAEFIDADTADRTDPLGWSRAPRNFRLVARISDHIFFQPEGGPSRADVMAYRDGG